MFFMGQEYGSRRPFVYFFDQPGEVGESLLKGRAKFLSQFESIRAIPHLTSICPILPIPIASKAANSSPQIAPNQKRSSFNGFFGTC